MPKYAVHDGYTVLNVIIAEDAESAEAVTGRSVIETDGSIGIGWSLIDGEWVGPVIEIGQADQDVE